MLSLGGKKVKKDKNVFRDVIVKITNNGGKRKKKERAFLWIEDGKKNV